MGFLHHIFGNGNSNETESVKRRKSLRSRICRLEEVEPREMLSASPYEPPAPIDVGIVYHEDYNEGLESNKGDQGGDTFVIAWSGGAAGTTLDRVVIDLNKSGDYQHSADIHFNVDGRIPNRAGTFFDFSADLAENETGGIVVKSILVSEDGKTLTIEFENFTADKQFHFKIDVDEMGGEVKPEVDRLVSGKEMEGAVFSGTFSSTDYEDSRFSLTMLDYYSDEKAGLIGVPKDAWYADKDDRDNTAGALGRLDVQKPLAGSISGHVYEDMNNDGVKDPGEQGIDGVWLELLVMNDKGQYVRYGDGGLKVKTSGGGYYCFNNIEGGRTYMVVETQPDGYADGNDTPGTIAGITVGEYQTPDTLKDIHIGANEHGVDYNFGELKRASLSGYVYHDRNNDGNRENGEEGISGVTVKLQRLNSLGRYEDVLGLDGRPLVAVTGSDGKYVFENLDPFQTYRVVENQPDGWIDGKDAVGFVGGVKTGANPDSDKLDGILLGYDQHGVDYNFGEYKNGSISGHVYEDDNNNGRKDPDEPGLPGVTIWLCVVNEHGEKVNIRQTVTDENGRYEFTDLEPGKTYCVTEVDPEGYCDGETNVGSLGGEVNQDVEPGYDQIHDIRLGSGEQGVNYNFGENLRGRLSGHVYEDKNENGIQDEGETGIAGVVLTLWVFKDGEYVRTGKTATTNEHGYYEFTGLCPFNTYRITEAQPADYLDGQDRVGTIDGVLTGTRSGNDEISGILLPPGGKGVHYDFGEIVKGDGPPPVDQPGSLSGYVYADADKNGSKDNDESGIPGVTLTLWVLKNGHYESTGKTATTDANGRYVFSNLDPNETYMIVETQPTAYDDGDETVGTLGGDKSENDKIKGIALGSGQQGTNYNFGELVKGDEPPPLDRPGSISGYVYVDTDKNGSKDDGEPGIQGVTLTVYKLVGGTYVELRSTTTDSNGYYIFADLDPNETYMIVETQPTAYDDGDESVGTLGGDRSQNDQIKAIALGSNQHGSDYNFGEWVRETDPTPDPDPNPEPDPRPNPDPPSIPSNIVDRSNSGNPGVGTGSAPDWQPPTPSDMLQPGYGGGGLPSGYSWHLSVVNAGYPRDIASSRASANGLYAADAAMQRTMLLDDGSDEVDAKTRYVSVNWTPLPMNQSVWYVRDKDGKVSRRFAFGPEGGRPLVADFNGDGIAQLAVYHNGQWYIDLNGNGQWDEEDLWCELGTASDQPIVGDWDGDGKADIGIFGPQWHGDAEIVANEPGLPSDLNPTLTVRPKNMPPAVDINSEATNVRAMKHSTGGQIRLDVIDHVFQYGGEGDRAFVGDFSGDGVKKIGIYRNGHWYIDYNGNGQWDNEDVFVDGTELLDGLPGGDKAIPVVGDWDGDGVDNIGLFVNGVWHLDTTGNFQFDTTIEFGEAGDMPVVGDFSGDGVDQLAVVRSDSLDTQYTRSVPTSAPAVSVGETSPMYARNVMPESATAKTSSADGSTVDQGTFSEELQRHERTQTTPFTNVPLNR